LGKVWLGRVVDAFGNPLDERPAIETGEVYPIHAPPPLHLPRRQILNPFARHSGDRWMLTLGCGQRVGIYAGAGVGKSTLSGHDLQVFASRRQRDGLIGGARPRG